MATTGLSENQLISDILARIESSLPHNKVKGTDTSLKHRKEVSGEAVLEFLKSSECTTLIFLAKYKATKILEDLDKLLCKVSEIQSGGRKDDTRSLGEDLVAQSQLILLGLMHQCVSKLEKSKVMENVLSSNFVADITEHCKMFIQVKEDRRGNYRNRILMEKAGDVIFSLTAFNFNAVFKILDDEIQRMKSTKEDIIDYSTLSLIQYCSYNYNHLESLLIRLASYAHTLKKDQQLFFASILRNGIWKWISTSPDEFRQHLIKQEVPRAPTGAEAMFVIIENWTDGGKKKGTFWPVMTTLLILCPEMLKNALDSKSTKAKSAEKFLDALKKSLTSKQLSQMASQCYVDICKASTFVKKQDSNALREIVPHIENDLKDKLFSPLKPPMLPDGTINEDLMVDCMVSFFKLNSRSVVGQLFPICLDTDSPVIFKFVLVRSLLEIAVETKVQPWNPTLKAAYSVAPRLRAMLSELVGANTKTQEKSPGSEKKKKKGENLAMIPPEMKKIYETNMLSALLKLYNADPHFSLLSLNLIQDLTLECRNLMVSLCACLTNDSDPDIPYLAAKLLHELHAPKYIEMWCPPDLSRGFWDVTSALYQSLSEMLQEADDPSVIYQLLNVLVDFLREKNNFLVLRRDELEVYQQLQKKRVIANTSLEISLLLHLNNKDPVICSLVVQAFGLLCNEIEILEMETKSKAEGLEPTEAQFKDVNFRSSDIGLNYELWKRLSEEGLLQTGRVAQQKTIRQLLRLMERQSHGIVICWGIVHQKFEHTMRKAYEKIEEREQAEDEEKENMGQILEQDEMIQWQNYIGFLGSLGGVCLSSDMLIQNVKVAPTPQKVKKEKGIAEERASLVKIFVNSVIDLVTSCQDVYLRESVRPVFATTLSADLYPTLFSTLKDRISSAFSKSGEVKTTDEMTLYISQTISVIRGIFDRPQRSDDLSLVDFESILSMIVRYLAQLNLSRETVQIRLLLCIGIEQILNQRHLVSFRNETKFCNYVLEYIIEWTSYFVEINSGSSTQEIENALGSEWLKLKNDLDLNAMKAISALLLGLPLQSTERNKAEGASPQQIKFKLFSQIFAFLYAALRSWKSNKSGPKGCGDYIINSLSSILHSNIDIGLEYVVRMGFIEDTETRAAFLKVLTNIINQGAAFDSLQSRDETEDKYQRFEEFIMKEKEVVNALIAVNIAGNDGLSRALLNFYDEKGEALTLVKNVLSAEIMGTDLENTLFRRNSCASKIFSLYSKFTGLPYMKQTLGPVLNELCSEEPVGLELIGQEVRDGEMQFARLSDYCKQIMARLVQESGKFPNQLREVLIHMRKEIQMKFGDEKNATSLVVGFTFLRFINPLIVAADIQGLCDTELTKEHRKSLIYITKVLQNVGNRILFGQKETYMAPMNSFVQESIQETLPKIEETFLKMTGDQENMEIGTIEHSLEECFQQIHYYFHSSLVQVGRHMYEKKRGQLFDQLQAIVGTLGIPPDIGKSLKSSSQVGEGDRGISAFFNEFMSRTAREYESLDSAEKEKMKAMFYKHGLSFQREPFFYFIARKMEDDVDGDIVLYHVFHTLQSSMRKHFNILIDCTLFEAIAGANFERSLKRFLKILPVVASRQVRNIFILNPNSVIAAYAGKKIRRSISNKSIKKMIFLQNSSELTKYVAEAEVGIPPATQNHESDVKTSFSDVQLMFGHKGPTSDIQLRVSSSHVQFVTPKETVLGKHATLYDFIPISRILNLSYDETTSNEFSMEVNWYGEENVVIILKSEVAKQIFNNISAVMARSGLLVNEEDKVAPLKPKDVPGALVNMALLNLGSRTSATRHAAYDLLTAITAAFKFSLGKDFMTTADLYIPHQISFYVLEISRALSESESSLTLEFLNQAIGTFDKASYIQKSLSIDFVEPWLGNLKDYNTGSTAKDVAKIIRDFVNLTINEKELYTTFLNKIWPSIGRIEGIVPVVVSELIEGAFKKNKKLSFSKLDIVQAICANVASTSGDKIPEELITRLLNYFNEEKEDTISSMEKISDGSDEVLDVSFMGANQNEFDVMLILCRMMSSLSFENALNVEKFFPDICHIVMMIFPERSRSMRETIYQISTNMLHSFYTNIVKNEEKKQAIKLLLEEISQPKFKLVFLGSKVSTSIEKTPIGSIETVAQFLISLHDAALDESVYFSNTWANRWREITEKATMDKNPITKIRSLVTLGVISKAPISDEMLACVIGELREGLDVMRMAFNKFVLSESGDTPLDPVYYDQVIAALICLNRIFPMIPPRNRLVKPIFWLTMSLIHISELSIFSYAVILMETILKTFDDQEAFEDSSMEYFVMDEEALPKPLSEALKRAEDVIGLRFQSNNAAMFSFAITGSLLKGLKHPSTKTATIRLLNTFVDVSSKRQLGTTSLGYLTALLPLSSKLEGDFLMRRLSESINRENEEREGLFSPLMLPDDTSAILLVTLLVTILKNTEYESEQLAIYNLLKDGVESVPSVFPMVYDLLIPKMSVVLNQSQNVSVLESVLGVISSMLAGVVTQGTRSLNTAFLNQIGFKGLPECGSFQAITPGRKEVCIHLAINFVNRCLKM